MSRLLSIDSSLYSLRYPLKFFGASLGRVVSLFRLNSGNVVIHSTGPFSDEDKHRIEKIGPVAAVIDITSFHDTYAKQGRSCFPDARYFAPKNFPLFAELGAESIEKGSELWGDQLQWVLLEGVPTLNEWACYHSQSKTLVLGDLLFNCKPDNFMGKLFFAVAGIRGWPGNCRLFRLCIRDRAALETSIQKILKFDFQRLIVAHGEPVEIEVRQVFIKAIRRAFPWMKLET